jgi:hypothetical protein
MGNYNPHQPNNIGQEWVPIRNELTEINHLIDEVEYGHSFSLLTSRTLSDARFYVHEMNSDVSTATYKLAVYPKGTEHLSGPIRSTIIPVETVAVTGGCTAIGSPPSGAEALLTPALDYYYNFSTTSLYSVMWLTFNTGATTNSNLLTGKRILGVNLLLGASIDWTIQSNAPQVGVTNSATVFGGTKALGEFNCPTGSLSTPTSRFKFGEFPFYNSATLVTGEVLPWTQADLNLLDSSGSIFVQIGTGAFINSPPVGHSMQVWYAALEVVYCEEQRVALGGWGYGPAGRGGNFINYGANVAPMRTWQGKVLNPALNTGDYTLTIGSYDLGDLWAPAQISPLQMNAARQLYPMAQQGGIQINLPFPPENNIGEVFTRQETDVLTQLTLHTSGGALTELHVYGRQIAAQVWNGKNADQDIFNSYGGSQTYNYARFYARRFGDTSSPLSFLGTGGATGAGSIAAVDFDELPEIIDGWKEVTLTLTTPATLGNTFSSNYRWTNEDPPGSRWEILGAAAPAMSGLPANLIGKATQQLGDATYYAPSGSAFEATWYPNGVTDRYITSSTDDPASDMVLIFGMQAPAPTAFTGAVQSQAVVGVGLDCGIPPCGIASGVYYNRLTWALPVNSGFASDEFGRTTASGWGNADSGQAWGVGGGAAASQWSTSPTTGGQILPTATASDRLISLDTGGINQDVRMRMRVDTIVASGTYSVGPMGRYVDSSNSIYARLNQGTTGTTSILQLIQRVAGVNTTLASLDTRFLPSVGYMNLRLQIEGSYARAKVWGDVEEEPDWTIMSAFTGSTTGTKAGVFVRNDTAVTTISTFVSDFTVVPSERNFGYYELQRDDSLSDWATIMQATSTAVTGFNDYEARVGLASSYRLRTVDALGFEGSWTSTVDLTIPTPGATGGSCLNTGHMLLFSSNMSQTGAYTLAYSSAWEDSQVSEEFTFPESSFVQLQPMYGKDFFTAFRPDERGGDRFQRNVLVQAAAISPETLADFTSLRDMAWAGNPYTCVRDEDGNRWFASVGVPSGKVVHNRTIYLAAVDVAEVTDTPAPVDP